jgi:hypothetical protein
VVTAAACITAAAVIYRSESATLTIADRDVPGYAVVVAAVGIRAERRRDA